MKVWEHKLVIFGVVLAGMLFLFAAFKPALNGQPLNVAFMLVGAVCIIVGVVLSRKSRDGAPPPSP